MSAPTPPSLGAADEGGVSRRLFVRNAAHGLATGGLALVVAGCGVRLDLPQPLPAAPTRKRAADEALLVSVVRGLTQIVKAEKALLPKAGAQGGGSTDRDDEEVIATLVALHAKQVEVLTGRLTNVGVPLRQIRPQATSKPAARTASVAALAARLATLDQAMWTAVAAATRTGRELLVSVYSLRLAGAVSLGQQVAVPEQPSPVREAIVARTRPLVYAFEVVAAQSGGAQRERALSTLTRLRLLEAQVAAGSSTAPTGWALPFEVTTAAAARRLAAHVLSAAVDSLLDVSAPNPSADSLQDAAVWSAHVQFLGVDWSVPLTAFPGTRR